MLQTNYQGNIFIISNSKFYTDIIRSAFYYTGEILEKGIPRNDIYFDKNKYVQVKKRIMNEMAISPDSYIVLYAPTFRNDGLSSHFKINWAPILSSINQRTGRPAVVFLRLHPNSLGIVNLEELVSNKVYNLCFYPDMQELLLISDLLITDYSSTMFEMGLQKKPCILYTPDLLSYDRDFYFDIKSLPYPLSETEKELEENIVSFDNESYLKQLEEFNNKHLKNYDFGEACKAFYEWMSNKSI